MEVYETVRTVLAVRSYESKPIPAEAVRHILEAGRLTASSMNKQPWHFIVVEDREMIKKLGQLASTGSYIAQAPLAIVVLIKETRFSISDASRAIQSMVLTAWEQGIGSNWVGFFGLEKAKPLLEIPDEWQVLAILPFGYPTESIGAGVKDRKPLSEVASKEKFGQSLA